MKLWKKRRRQADLQPAPLTPAQVVAMRRREEVRIVWLTRGYIVMSMLGAAGLAVFFLRHEPGAYRSLAALELVNVIMYAVALIPSFFGGASGSAVFALVGGATMVWPLTAALSTSTQVHLYLYGIAFASFVIIRSELVITRVVLGGLFVAEFVALELLYPAGRGSAELSPQVSMDLAMVNRLCAVALVALVAVLIQYRFVSTRRVLEGAARYGELRATTDELTGVYNRRPVIAQLAEWAHRGRGNYAIALIDLDNFKTINDQFGHDCGDLIIQEVAATMREHFRDTDMVSRWGGDEFLVLMPGIRHSDLIPVLERLRRAVSRIDKRCNNHPHSVTVSIGAAMGSHEQTPDECIAAADHALYRAKAEGRNRVVAVGVSMPHQALGRPSDPDLEWQEDLVDRSA